MEENNNIKTATILEIQRMSTEDGPGIRTSVFFKGCPLSCIWCHNPESISPKPQTQWIENKCIGCGICVDTCPEKALTRTPAGIIINREICNGCGMCTRECPSLAMELLGKKWELNELFNEVVKDRAYFEKSGGGITVSGGEPAIQVEFVENFLKKCKSENINTALDTCGLCSHKVYDRLMPYTDILLYDLKFINSDLHKKYTFQPSEKILQNLLYIKELIIENQMPTIVWIRTPLIPETTTTEGNITEIGSFIAEHLNGIIDRWELCAFNNLCKDKYRRLSIEWPYRETKLLSRDTLNYFTKIAKTTGVDEHKILWTGSTRIEEDFVSERNEKGNEPSF